MAKGGRTAALLPAWWSRLLFTLASVLVLWLLHRLPAPGLHGWDGAPMTGPAAPLYAFATLGRVGVMPLVWAALVVEAAAAAVPGWRSLRHGFEGRRKLATATVLVAMLFAAWRTYTVVDFLSDNPMQVWVLDSAIIMAASLMGSFAIIVMVVTALTNRGLGHGVVLAALLSAAIDATRPATTLTIVQSDSGPWPGVAVFAIVVVTTIAVVTLGKRRGRGAAGLVVPTSGVVALPLVYASIHSPYLAKLMRMPAAAPPAMVIAVMVVVAALIAWLSHTPEAVAHAWGQKREAASRAVLHAIVLSALFVGVLAGTDVISGELLIGSKAFEAALLAAVLVDAHAAWVDRDARVLVATFNTPFRAEAARAHLEREDIRCALVDQQQRSMLQLFGPFAPVRLAVAADDSERALEILEDLDLLGGPPTANEEPPPNEKLAPSRLRWGGPLLAIVAMFAMVVGAKALLVPAPEITHVEPGTLEFTLLHDTEWMKDLSSLRDTPEGVDYLIENVPDGPGRTLPIWYAQVNGSTVPDATKAYFDQHAPPDTRIAWGKIHTRDEETHRYEHIGWRTYTLKGEALLDGSDVDHVVAALDESDYGGSWYVTVQFTPDAGERFHRITAENVKRRFAILLNGVVESAPEIREPIGGGVARITMGAGTMAEQRRDARKLELMFRKGRSDL